MRKKILLLVSIILIISIFNFKVVSADEKLYLGGMPAGFLLQTRGAEIVGICDVITENGLESPCKNAQIEVGDIILYIDNKQINNANDIEKTVNSDKEISVEIKRNDQIITKIVKPQKDMSGNYKLGVFIKDNVSGIGTITYIKGDRIASLGHPIIDDNGNIIEILGGKVYSCNITGAIKGVKGKAGELRGIFLKNNPIANIDKNLQCGVFGSLSKNYDKKDLKEVGIGKAIPGEASIYSTINGETPLEYSISIIKADNSLENKNFVIKVTDKKLIESTGGIIQGMSGSPIIQNGKLVGAVTHVFINDPTRGFGIDLSNMINN